MMKSENFSCRVNLVAGIKLQNRYPKSGNNTKIFLGIDRENSIKRF